MLQRAHLVRQRVEQFVRLNPSSHIFAAIDVVDPADADADADADDMKKY